MKSRYKILTGMWTTVKATANRMFRKLVSARGVVHAVYFAFTLFVCWLANAKNHRLFSHEKLRRVTGFPDVAYCFLCIQLKLLYFIALSRQKMAKKTNECWQCHHKCFTLYLFRSIKIHLWSNFIRRTPSCTQLDGVPEIATAC